MPAAGVDTTYAHWLKMAARLERVKSTSINITNEINEQTPCIDELMEGQQTIFPMKLQKKIASTKN